MVKCILPYTPCFKHISKLFYYKEFWKIFIANFNNLSKKILTTTPNKTTKVSFDINFSITVNIRQAKKNEPRQ